MQNCVKCVNIASYFRFWQLSKVKHFQSYSSLKFETPYTWMFILFQIYVFISISCTSYMLLAYIKNCFTCIARLNRSKLHSVMLLKWLKNTNIFCFRIHGNLLLVRMNAIRICCLLAIAEGIVVMSSFMHICTKETPIYNHKIWE